MKKIVSFLAIVLLAVSFTSCGDDDKPQKPTWPETIDETKAYTLDILALKGSQFTVPLSVELKDFPKIIKLEDKIKNAKARTPSFIKITGITKGQHKLSNLVLKVEGTNIQKVIGDVKADKIYDEVEDLMFLQRLAQRLVQTKKANLIIQATSEKEINKTVKIEVNLAVRFEMHQ